MFKKVLIAEDHEIANISVQKTLHELGIQNAKYVYYCDDALTWIKNAQRDGERYDLLITDLTFEVDHNPQRIAGGIELIKEVKAIQPNLKVIVLSAESRSAVIDELFKTRAIDGYVRKARRDAQYLKEALQAACQDKTYQSPEIKQSIREKNSHEFSNLDIHIIALLSQGIRQKDIPFYLLQKEIRPSGLSSVEKRLNLMKEVLEFSKNEQLIAYSKDIGII
ncbi:response regulator [Sphingobacterium sp. SG20118]|uniref:response regulator n=1 Tax=Sphingobacterium TaxID=28453 RepID=UPI0004F80092|nr:MULTISPECIES: response regulator [Sphingobacterium]AIM38043.1 transcriptional regulator [Sphingobacterium sp. ML3W]MDH5825886.1 response regulator [Sphingobacterium faecium]